MFSFDCMRVSSYIITHTSFLFFSDSTSTGIHGSSSSTAWSTTESTNLVGRVERHQLTVLATAFFLTEHFSAPPIYPVLTDFGSGLTEMLSGLTSNLFRLAHSMLSDSVASLIAPSGAQTSTLSVSCFIPSVVGCWST